MKGLLDGDKKLQVEALLGLIAASKKLGLDPTRYNNALRTLRPDLAEGGTKAKPKPQTKVQKSRSVEKNGGKRRKLLSGKVENGHLRLKFSAPIPTDGVRHFVLKRKGYYLYVFDIAPVRLPYAIKRIKGEGFKEVRIAQYDPRKIRVVVETKKRYKPRHTFDGNEIRIPLPGAAADESRKSKAAKRSLPASGPAAKPASKPSAKTKAPAAEAGPALPGSMLRRYTVVIDPGHGGKDAGAVGYMRKKEKDAVLAVAKELKKVLRKRGFNVYLTRERDVFIPLKRRTRLANRKQADFFISIHANAAPKKSHWLKSKGIETYFLSRARTKRAKRVAAIENSAEIKNIDRYTKEAYLSVLNREKIIESNKLAIDLQRQMLTAVRSRYKDVVDNGVREGPFWVLVGAQMPAVLIEIGYITNPTEAKRLFSTRYRKLLAEGIANGIESYIYHNK
ncbi:N-acetylmuramoyl-L-alanine amidase [Hydrogenimonas sp.]